MSAELGSYPPADATGDVASNPPHETVENTNTNINNSTDETNGDATNEPNSEPNADANPDANADDEDQDEDDEAEDAGPTAGQRVIAGTEDVFCGSFARAAYGFKTLWNVAEVIVIIVILAKYYHTVCDEVILRRYLIMRAVEAFCLIPLHFAATFRRRTPAEYLSRIILYLFTIAISIYAIVGLARSHTCRHTNRPVWGTTIAMLVATGATPVAFLFCAVLACCFVGLVLCFCGPEKPKAATTRQLKNLPKETYNTDTTQLKHGTQCPICMCDFENDEQIYILPCGHAFHVPCGDNWFVINRTCPECRSDPFEKKKPDAPTPAPAAASV